MAFFLVPRSQLVGSSNIASSADKVTCHASYSHCRIIGSILSVIIEHFAGAFPAWLAPDQGHIIPVNQAHEEYAQTLVQRLKDAGGRFEYHDASDSLGKRIRNAQKAKVPYSIIIGDKEIESGNLTVRKYGEQSDQQVSEKDFLEMLES